MNPPLLGNVNVGQQGEVAGQVISRRLGARAADVLAHPVVLVESGRVGFVVAEGDAIQIQFEPDPLLVMRKLVHLIYGVVKSGKPFDANLAISGVAIQDGI